MTPDLYISKPDLDTHVSYRLMDARDQIIEDYKNVSCFSAITYERIPAQTKSIVIYRIFTKIPYAMETIERWIKELNALGFPCSAHAPTRQTVHFVVNLADYTYKMHLNCALQLIRCLFEQYICYVPAFYFADQSEDRFAALQNAHKRLGEDDETRYFNSNHTIICRAYGGNGNVSRETLFDRIAKTQIKTFGLGRARLTSLWYGEDTKVSPVVLKLGLSIDKDAKIDRKVPDLKEVMP